MSNKVSLKNSKDQNFENYRGKVFNILEKKAQNLFKDKYFHEEFKAVFAFTSILRIISSLVSFFTGFVAVQMATKLLFGSYLSVFFALSVCVCLEVVKTFFWRINSKWILKYKKVSRPIVGSLVGLHVLSLAFSAYGGWLLPLMARTPTLPKVKIINLDDVAKPFVESIAKIDAQITANSAKIAKTTSNSTVRSLNVISKTLLEQKAAQETAKNRAILNATTKNNILQAKTDQKAQKAQKTRSKAVFVAQISCLVASLFFEFLFVACSVFGVYYLFRLNIDVEAEKQPESLPSKQQNTQQAENEALDGKKTPSEQPENGKNEQPHKAPKAKAPKKRIGYFKDHSESPKICQLESCGNSFESKVHNKLFCSSECRKLAYQQRRYETKSKTSKN